MLIKKKMAGGPKRRQRGLSLGKFLCLGTGTAQECKPQTGSQKHRKGALRAAHETIISGSRRVAKAQPAKRERKKEKEGTKTRCFLFFRKAGIEWHGVQPQRRESHKPYLFRL